MSGTIFDVTLPIRLIPPIMTSAVSAASTIPVRPRGIEKASCSARATEFACTMLPMPNEASTPKNAKR
ncbi:hypothetical protein MD536_21155, partial [Flavihumibacter cheonanensis]